MARNPWKSVELHSEALGQKVTLEFSPRKTVLVGRNGAGKSAILDALFESRVTVLFGNDAFRPNISLRCVYVNDEGQKFDYRFASHVEFQVEGHEPTRRVTESCKRVGRPDYLWITKEGRTTGTFFEGEIRTPVGIGFVAAMRGDGGPTDAISDLLGGVSLVRAGVPRSTSRSAVYVYSGSRRARRMNNRLESLVANLLRLRERDEESFAEFEALMVELKLVKAVQTHSFEVAPGHDEDAVQEMQTVTFDECNIGFLSDGTLRVAEIIYAVVSRPTLLAIEEPETSLHPALLGRVLSVLDSYSRVFQMLVTTQSPQVVSWAQAKEVRLVRREFSKTHVRKIAANAAKRVETYLADDLSLGEFIYSGSVDE